MRSFLFAFVASITFIFSFTILPALAVESSSESLRSSLIPGNGTGQDSAYEHTLEGMAHTPPFSKAYQTMMTLPRWATLPRAVTTPAQSLVIAGKPYFMGTLCKPHSCASDQLVVIFTKDGRKAWGLFAISRGDARYEMPLGEPDSAILKVLTETLHKTMP
ncbi:MAG: hypothetical protein IJ934_00130 [Acetobacter sp.]|nr:hypothetical protein [Acetobacter sp.]